MSDVQKIRERYLALGAPRSGRENEYQATISLLLAAYRELEAKNERLQEEKAADLGAYNAVVDEMRLQRAGYENEKVRAEQIEARLAEAEKVLREVERFGVASGFHRAADIVRGFLSAQEAPK